MKKLSTLLGFTLASVGALAQNTPVTDSTLAVPASAAPAQIAPQLLTFYGFVDGYYGIDFPSPGTQTRPGFLYSHNRQNEFTVNQGLVGLRYDNGAVRGAFGVHAGSYVSANYAAEDQVFKHIYEAYAGFRPFANAWLDVGIFGSHIGFESAISKDNWTLTRSLMAENSPYYEAGGRFTYEVNSKLTLTGLILNGWQNIRENNQAKAVGTQIQWKPSDKILINSSSFYGNEQPTDSLVRRRYFHDFYISYAATDNVSLAMVFDVGKQESGRSGDNTQAKYDTWHTGAAFVRYKLSEKWTTALRGEYYKADSGVIIGSFAPIVGANEVFVRGGSFNLDYAPTTNVVVRLEGRVLNAKNDIFPAADGQSHSTYGNLTSSVAISF